MTLDAIFESQILRIRQTLREPYQPEPSPRFCHGCRVREIRAGERLCGRCAYSRSYAARSKRVYGEGICAKCRLAPAEPGVTRCADCREKHNAQRRAERRAQVKERRAAERQKQIAFFGSLKGVTHAQA